MSLCDTCQYSTRLTRRNNAVTYYCSEIGGIGDKEIPGDIEKCSGYHHKNSVGRRQMEMIAWTLRTDTSGKILGFAPPKEKKDEFEP